MCETITPPFLCKLLQADTASRAEVRGWGGGDTPIYGRYRYVPRDRIGFLRFVVFNSIVYPVPSLDREPAQLNEKQIIC